MQLRKDVLLSDEFFYLYDMSSQQTLQEDDFKEEDYNLFQTAGQKCLDEGYTTQILEAIQDEKNKVIFKSMGWNLVSPVIRCFRSHEHDKEKRKECLKIIDQMVQVCNPKELLLGLLEQIEEAAGEEISQTILLLIQPLQTVLLKLGHKKAYSVGLSLSTLMSQLSNLPVPYTKEQMQEDKHGLCLCSNTLVKFAQPFVEEVLKTPNLSTGSGSEELKAELLKFCFSCFKYPLLNAQLDQQPEDPYEHPFRHFATGILGILLSIGDPLCKVFTKPGSMKLTVDDEALSEEDAKCAAESLACLAYLLFVQYIGMEQFPTVFGPAFLLQCNLTHIEVLLKSHLLFPRTEESVLSKGIDLFENSLLRVDDGSLPHHYLDINIFLRIPQDLVKVMTHCPIEHLRKKSLKILQLYIDKFEVGGKYKLLRCLLKTSNHAGVQGYIIQNIKNQIELSLKTEHDIKWFSGSSMVPLLHMVLSLPDGVETDLLVNSDRIMASLNLLRYVIIRDSVHDNQTEIWTELNRIENNFLKPLHTALNMSKAHYEAELKNAKENLHASSDKNTVCSVTVDGKKSPKMDTGMQLQVLKSALFTFDLMESVLARVEEIIEVNVKSIAE
ncbi:glomulin isoform X3 [Ambystoma mexicanum]